MEQGGADPQPAARGGREGERDAGPQQPHSGGQPPPAAASRRDPRAQGEHWACLAIRPSWEGQGSGSGTGGGMGWGGVGGGSQTFAPRSTGELPLSPSSIPCPHLQPLRKFSKL